MLLRWFAWMWFVQEIHNVLSGDPPLITDFQSDDLDQPGDVLPGSGFNLPCKAAGTNPLEYRWQHNGQDIKYGQQYRLLKSGSLEGKLLSSSNNGEYQCFVKNDFGEDFSRKLKVVVSVAGDFIYANDKLAPVTLGKPVEIHCPKHEPSFGVTYRWGGYSLPSVPRSFLPLLENKRIAVTLDGTLVIMFVTTEDVFKVNNMGGILCEMTLGSEEKYSHKVSFKQQGNEFTGFTAPSIYFSPKPQEEARKGYQKKLYCLGVAKPTPYLIWRKNGEKIVDGEDGYHLPADHYNRLLIIKDVTEEHQGNYSCTAYPTSGSFDQASVTTFLTVKASPEWEVELPSNTSAARSQTTSLRCVAKGAPPPFYRWFRNGWKIDDSDSRVKLQKNILKLVNVDSWHEAVFQCVAENSQGMSVTSTRVYVEDSPTNVGPSSRREGDSDELLWIILSAVLGVLLIVSIVVVIVCYKRLKKSRREQERPSEGTSHYNDISDDMESNPSQSRTAPPGAKGGKGLRRHPTLPPIPQYQTLNPSTAGVANYEPLDVEQDLNESGLYEKLDFRSLDNDPDYDNPGKPIPEYLELVDDTNVIPGNTASTVTTGGPGKEYYQPMEGDLRNDVFHDSSSAPKNYVPMEMEGSKTKTPNQPGPLSPKYYEPMAGKLESAPETKGKTSSAEYYQPMADKAGEKQQGENSFSSPEYYVPMAENNLIELAVQTNNTQAKCGEGTKDNSDSSKL